jgi:alkanesulfonate monooxygenase SsuD/methylene tetrahydromethanopterin reductase-like flavin-dependent oxidoreductase (luciferase family)
LLLGLGVANKSIAGWHGGVFDRPLKRAREYIDIVRKVAAGERVEYDGEIYQTGKRFQLSWKPSHPGLPIYLAGLGPQMTKLVGKISDGVFINMATPAKVKEIAARVREGALEAGRDPSKIEIIAKSRVSLNPDKQAARNKLRQVLTFYNIADHYSDMLRGMGFEKEVNAIHEAFQKGGFKAAMGALTDDYMDKLPVVPASNIAEIKEKMKEFEEAGTTRMVIPYVPVTEPVEDARRFLEAWGKA